MQEKSITVLAERLKKILADEKAALQSGQAQQTAAMIEDKMIAMQAFESSISTDQVGTLLPAQIEQIETVIQMAKENASHFDAIRNGLRNIITRIEGLNTSAFVGAYNKQGASMPFTGATGQYLKKV